jgi:hypothetical protein
MTSKHVQYLQDTLNGVSLKQQANARGVSGSSQSSVLKTAMRILLQHKAVRSNKNNFDVIAHDKKVQHLNRHRSFWQQALQDYLSYEVNVVKPKSDFMSELPSTEKMLAAPDGRLVTRVRNNVIYQGNIPVRKLTSITQPKPRTIEFSFDNIAELEDFVTNDRYEIDPLQIVNLTFNTILKQYDVRER